MQRLRYALACAALCAFAASSAQASSTATKTAQLSKVIINPDIPKANQRVKVGTICLFAGSPIDFGSGERTVNLERFERLFSAMMNTRGFNVVAKSSNLFEGEGSSPGSDFLIGATFRPQSVDICDSVNGQKGTIAISVEWQIYDRSKQQVVETATSQGSGQLLKFQMNGLNVMIDQAFSAAITALIDQDMLQKHLGNPAPQQLTTEGEQPLSAIQLQKQ